MALNGAQLGRGSKVDARPRGSQGAVKVSRNFSIWIKARIDPGRSKEGA